MVGGASAGRIRDLNCNDADDADDTDTPLLIERRQAWSKQNGLCFLFLGELLGAS
jgi:hypothetical protein